MRPLVTSLLKSDKSPLKPTTMLSKGFLVHILELLIIFSSQMCFLVELLSLIPSDANI